MNSTPGSVPDVDFVGAMNVESLEIGVVELKKQSIPAVRFSVHKNQQYSILASGHQAGEIYAYCAVALEHGIKDIDVKMACALLMDASGALHMTVSKITWYTSSDLRERAAVKLLNVFEKGAQKKFKVCSTPFMKIQS
jgi:hypothetical protein